MKEWICREMSTSTSGNENGVLMMETELIRCRDCKHYADECCDRYADETLGYVHSTQESGYCWVAERKEE